MLYHNKKTYMLTPVEEIASENRLILDGFCEDHDELLAYMHNQATAGLNIFVNPSVAKVAGRSMYYSPTAIKLLKGHSAFKDFFEHYQQEQQRLMALPLPEPFYDALHVYLVALHHIGHRHFPWAFVTVSGDDDSESMALCNAAKIKFFETIQIDATLEQKKAFLLTPIYASLRDHPEPEQLNFWAVATGSAFDCVISQQIYLWCLLLAKKDALQVPYEVHAHWQAKHIYFAPAQCAAPTHDSAWLVDETPVIHPITHLLILLMVLIESTNQLIASLSLFQSTFITQAVVALVNIASPEMQHMQTLMGPYVRFTLANRINPHHRLNSHIDTALRMLQQRLLPHLTRGSRLDLVGDVVKILAYYWVADKLRQDFFAQSLDTALADFATGRLRISDARFQQSLGSLFVLLTDAELHMHYLPRLVDRGLKWGNDSFSLPQAFIRGDWLTPIMMVMSALIVFSYVATGLATANAMLSVNALSQHFLKAAPEQLLEKATLWLLHLANDLLGAAVMLMLMEDYLKHVVRSINLALLAVNRILESRDPVVMPHVPNGATDFPLAAIHQPTLPVAMPPERAGQLFLDARMLQDPHRRPSLS